MSNDAKKKGRREGGVDRLDGSSQRGEARCSGTEHVAVYAGSFDPITLGHLDVLRRARRMFDRIVLGIGHNPAKAALYTFDERLEMAQQLVAELVKRQPEGAPVRVANYSGLTVDFARECGAAVILRGIRNITDLASETQLAITNRQVADIETVFIVTGEQYAFTSSSLIRQVAAMGGALDRLDTLVPEVVLGRLAKMREEGDERLASVLNDDVD